VISRRSFLVRGAGGVLLVAAGALLPSGCTRYPKPEPRLRFFTAKEYAILNLLAARLLGVPALASGGEGGGVDVAENLDRMVLGWDADVKRQLRLALRVVEHGTYLFDLERKRFTKLSEAQQNHYLAGWAASTLGARRVAFLGIKSLVSMGYYATEWNGLGYPGPWLGRIEVEPRLEAEQAVPLS
jgi:hypothetical protein